MKTNFWLDVVLAVGLGMTLIPSIGGIRIHEAVGIALGLGVIVHLSLHWKWIVAMSKSFSKLPGTARFKLVLNILSLLAFSLTIVSGLMNSPVSPGGVGAAIVSRRGYPGFHWHVIHHASAMMTFLTAALHLALHREQIGRAAKRFVPRPLPNREIGS